MRAFVAAGMLAALLLALSPAASVAADETPALRIAVLDVERIRRSAAAVRSIRDQLGTYMEAYRSDTQREEQEIRSGQEDLARKRQILSSEAYAEERGKLERRLAEAQSRVQQRRELLERAHAEAMQQVQQALGKIVTDVATERGLTLILRKDQVVFVAASYEITDEVLSRLDQRLPSVRIAEHGG